LKTVRIETLGCRLNQIESEAAARFFIDSGFEVYMEGLSAASPSDSSTVLVIINTCAVTQKAEQKARRIIRLVLKKYQNACLLVTGCYAQLSRAEIERIDNRIVVLAGQVKSRIINIPQILQSFLKSGFEPVLFGEYLKKNVAQAPALKPGFPENSFALSTTTMLSHSRASLKIQDGCNSACSFCTIHIARGHSVSLDVNIALERVQALEESGYDEVVITTINSSQYKGKLVKEDGSVEYYDFVDLLSLFLEKTKKINFRISSLYPGLVTDAFCSVIKNKRVRPHFHISVQSGSNIILELMNRDYKREAVITACSKIRSSKPQAFIACDIITGFPDESEEDFEATLSLCKECNFSWIHAFPFSERPGTPACNLKNKVPQSISGQRAKEITALAIQNKIDYIKGFVGKALSAVVEKKVNQGYHCMTENFIHCQLQTDCELKANQSVIVKILKPLSEQIKKGGDIEALANPAQVIEDPAK